MAKGWGTYNDVAGEVIVRDCNRIYSLLYIMQVY